MNDTLYLVVPCYNEEAVLPETARQLEGTLQAMIADGHCGENSRILFVNDGSKDRTWAIIEDLHRTQPHVCGLSLSRNRGHQNALLAGLMFARAHADCAISLDADLQDDIGVLPEFLAKYHDGCDIVYGVRCDRKTDTKFKRSTAQFFYKLMSAMGVEIIYNHADYRLMSARAVKELSKFKEVNLFLRGMVPMIGFKYSCVEYSRKERMAGKSKYPLKKMISFALDGITSLSVKPIRFITTFGFIVALLSVIGIIWSVVTAFIGSSVAGWASTVSIVCFLGGVQLISLGVIGEYIGKIYLEVKQRPRYIIDKKTDELK